MGTGMCMVHAVPKDRLKRTAAKQATAAQQSSGHRQTDSTAQGTQTHQSSQAKYTRDTQAGTHYRTLNWDALHSNSHRQHCVDIILQPVPAAAFIKPSTSTSRQTHSKQ
jgi:hypothetical protein